MNFAIYEISSGLIKSRGTCFPAGVADQLQFYTGCEFYLNCPADATHIINNEPVTLAPVFSTDYLLEQIRIKRNRLLAACDWTQLPDVPQQQREAWAVYRQQLRDFPATCSINNPVWPEQP